jgi:fermentation-respiration switch protein FrsA (DUF1100 family)
MRWPLSSQALPRHRTLCNREAHELKTYQKLLILFSALMLVGTLFQILGVQLNDFVMAHNDDHMPVLELIKSSTFEFLMLVDPGHCKLTWESHYILLSDIIPAPYITLHDYGLSLSSIGDLFIRTGDFLLQFVPLGFVYLLAQGAKKLWNRLRS